MCQKGFIGCHGARPDKLRFDDLMIRFCGAPEREKERGERERLRDKMMKVFEASRGTSRRNNKGNDIHERVKRRERTRPKIQALRFLLGNYQKVGIKHKCIIMLTINTIMSALLASMFGCGDDVCGGMRRVWMCLWGKGVYLLASRLALVLFILFQEHNLENQLNQKHWRILSSLFPPHSFLSHLNLPVARSAHTFHRCNTRKKSRYNEAFLKWETHAHNHVKNNKIMIS